MGRIGHLLQDYLICLHIYYYRHAGDNAVVADPKERFGIGRADLELHVRLLHEYRRDDHCRDKCLNADRKGKPLDGYLQVKEHDP